MSYPKYHILNPDFHRALRNVGDCPLHHAMGRIPCDLNTISDLIMTHDDLTDSLRIHVNNLRFIEHGSQDPGLFLDRRWPNFPILIPKYSPRYHTIKQPEIMGKKY